MIATHLFLESQARPCFGRALTLQAARSVFMRSAARRSIKGMPNRIRAKTSQTRQACENAGTQIHTSTHDGFHKHPFHEALSKTDTIIYEESCC